jgi:hypothetical protein
VVIVAAVVVEAGDAVEVVAVDHAEEYAWDLTIVRLSNYYVNAFGGRGDANDQLEVFVSL